MMGPDVGRVVSFSAHLKSRALHAAELSGDRPPPGELAIRVMQTPPNIPGATPAHVGRWIWALVRTRGVNEPDQIICGGFSDSITECAARGEEAMSKELADGKR
jgi:hypothetical protein